MFHWPVTKCARPLHAGGDRAFFQEQTVSSAYWRTLQGFSSNSHQRWLHSTVVQDQTENSHPSFLCVSWVGFRGCFVCAFAVESEYVSVCLKSFLTELRILCYPSKSWPPNWTGSEYLFSSIKWLSSFKHLNLSRMWGQVWRDRLLTGTLMIGWHVMWWQKVYHHCTVCHQCVAVAKKYIYI